MWLLLVAVVVVAVHQIPVQETLLVLAVIGQMSLVNPPVVGQALKMPCRLQVGVTLLRLVQAVLGLPVGLEQKVKILFLGQ